MVGLGYLLANRLEAPELAEARTWFPEGRRRREHQRRVQPWLRYTRHKEM